MTSRVIWRERANTLKAVVSALLESAEKLERQRVTDHGEWIEERTGLRAELKRAGAELNTKEQTIRDAVADAFVARHDCTVMAEQVKRSAEDHRAKLLRGDERIEELESQIDGLEAERDRNQSEVRAILAAVGVPDDVDLITGIRQVAARANGGRAIVPVGRFAINTPARCDQLDMYGKRCWGAISHPGPHTSAVVDQHTEGWASAETPVGLRLPRQLTPDDVDDWAPDDDEVIPPDRQA